MSRRPPATLADYVLVGINPALIMILIDSLVFYLLCIFYGGGYDARVMFIFAMFIMGAVAVCRISMEEGAGYASMFAGPLGLVTMVAVNRFGEFHGALAAFSPVINAGILLLIWAIAYQLTWDCTVMDERADTSDQGLLQAAGLEGQPESNENAAEDPLDPFLAGIDEPKEEPSAFAKWFERGKQPHAHGVWVIYFSLGALPAFGLGQWFVPQPSRTFAFWMLVIYVATSLALLLSTSFLGLRRYLRKRRLEMPVEMTANWLGIGVILIAAVLAICLLIPRPGAELAVSQLPFPKMGSPNLNPSKWGWGSDGKKQDANAKAGSMQPSNQQSYQPGGQTSQTSGSGQQPGSSGQGQQSGSSGQQSQNRGQNSGGKSSSGQSSSGQSSGNQSNPTSGQSGQQGSAGKGTDDPASKGRQPGNKSDTPNPMMPNPPTFNPPPASPTMPQPNQTQSNAPQQNQSQQNQSQQNSQPPQNSQPQPPPRPPMSSPSAGSALLSGLGNLIKLVAYLAIAAILAFLAWRYRQELAAAWQQLLKELRELWARLFGGGEATAAASSEVAAAPTPPRPFAAFHDPFLTGRAGNMSRLELLRYTFEALQAWGREQGCPRQESETAHEYAQRLAGRAPHLAREAAALSDYYGQAAYAGRAIPDSVADPLRSLWHKLGAAAVA
jgi:hypothetical protein